MERPSARSGPVLFPDGQNQTFGQVHVQTAGQDYIQQTTSITKILHFHFGIFKKRSKKNAKKEDDPEEAWLWQSHDGRWRVRGVGNRSHDLLVGNGDARSRGQAYVRNMIPYGMGIPCWDPRRHNPYTPECGTSPGDVGTFTCAEGFSKIFNVWEDYESIMGLVGPQLARPEIVHRPKELCRGSTVTFGASANATVTSKLPLEFTFTCTSPECAILALTSSVDSEMLTKKSKHDLHCFIIQNSEVLYRHALYLTHLHLQESLYFVTGCFKTDTWAMAGYSGSTTKEDILRLQNINPPGEAEAFDWTARGHAQTAASDSEYRPTTKDQSLFLQGFSLSYQYKPRRRSFKEKIRSGNWSHLSDFNKDPFYDDSRSGSGSDRGYSSGGSGFGGRSGRSSSSSSTGSPTDDELRVATLVEQLQTNQPADFINQALLMETKARYALCHDDNWRFILKDCRWDEHGLAALIDAIENSPISVQNGVAFLARDRIDLSCVQCQSVQASNPNGAVAEPKSHPFDKSDAQHIPGNERADLKLENPTIESLELCESTTLDEYEMDGPGSIYNTPLSSSPPYTVYNTPYASPPSTVYNTPLSTPPEIPSLNLPTVSYEEHSLGPFEMAIYGQYDHDEVYDTINVPTVYHTPAMSLPTSPKSAPVKLAALDSLSNELDQRLAEVLASRAFY